ncbi:hypothetical protein OSH08_09415 [Kaistia geumhonensis]|uniref:Uncharacterized protein n=1 Tax=Kaistia geumhonensis TaxID=410839 RepID=A0ABU0M3L5_9HYPH|nr:hypothetical protein [Kaistia geumhonensis]MCX5479222.1 hypothetical protein [Kaistia geumhonensis]MDQ0515557.1 hypothetical protein [Kaistia geumhonensis]
MARTEKGGDLARSIAAGLRVPIETAVRARAGEVAAALGGAVEGGSARAETSAGGASVHVAGPGLFAREFGAIDGTSDPALAPALGRLKRRRP